MNCAPVNGSNVVSGFSRARWSCGKGRQSRTPYAGLNRVRLRTRLRRDPAVALRAQAGQVPRVCLNPSSTSSWNDLRTFEASRDTPGGRGELYSPRHGWIMSIMRMSLLFSFVAASVVTMSAQAPSTPAKPPQGTSQPKPAPPAPTPAAPAPAAPAAPAPAQPRRAPTTTARAGIAITVTDPMGGTLQGIRVEVTGTSTRNGETDGSGNLNFPGLMAGTYRLRFDGDKVISFEREVTLRAGQVLDVDVSLNPAPEPPPPPPRRRPRRQPRPSPQSGRRANRRASTLRCCSKRNSSARRHAASHCFPAAATSGRR